MVPNQIACYLSHLRAFQLIAEKPDDNGRYLVLEDDIIFRPDFDLIMPRVKQSLGGIDWDIVFLGLTPDDETQVELVAPYLAITGLATGMWAYMLTPKSARRLIPRLL